MKGGRSEELVSDLADAVANLPGIVVLADAFCCGSRQLIGVAQSSRSPSDSLKAQQHVAPVVAAPIHLALM